MEFYFKPIGAIDVQINDRWRIKFLYPFYSKFNKSFYLHLDSGLGYNCYGSGDEYYVILFGFGIGLNFCDAPKSKIKFENPAKMINENKKFLETSNKQQLTTK